MTNEEIQRTMEFILEQQAQFAASIQRDHPRLVRLEESFQLLVRLAENSDARLDKVESNANVLDARLDRVESTANVLDARLDRVESNANVLEANMAALAAAQTHTEERLSILIDIVREDRNGRS